MSFGRWYVSQTNSKVLLLKKTFRVFYPQAKLHHCWPILSYCIRYCFVKNRNDKVGNTTYFIMEIFKVCSKLNSKGWNQLFCNFLTIYLIIDWIRWLFSLNLF